MRLEILIQNLPLAVAINVIAYVWYRSGFRTPLSLPVSVGTIRRLLVSVGWVFIAAITVRAVASQFRDARMAIANSGQMYAYRSREPLLFWGQIVGELVLVGGTGAFLIVLGRRSSRAKANDA